MSRKPLTEKLERFASQIATSTKSKMDTIFPARYKLLADSVGGELVSGHAGCYCLVRSLFQAGHLHGSLTLKANGEATSLPSAAFSAKEATFNLAVPSMIFLDTETTGLGGSGAVAFLIGLGRMNGDSFEINQYLIPDYSDEASMLEDVNSLLNGNSTIISYNGASFDLPVLQDRMIINRVARKLNFRYHLDLLHSARRLFRRRLADCTLVNLERQLFSFHRTTDIPGYLVPSVYFEWLSSQELSRMNAVLEHNRYDILSLYFLVHLIAEAYQSEGSSLDHEEDLYSLSRFYERRKETRKIERVYDRFVESGNGLAPEAGLHYAQNFKRMQNLEKSVEIWKSVAADKGKMGFCACVELAKYYEHCERDYGQALEYSERASENDFITQEQTSFLKKRINRLNRKIKSTNGG